MTGRDEKRDGDVTEQPIAGAPLVLRLFGPFEALVHGKPLPRLRSRKGHWLLALLILKHGREVEREWLADALWPDSLRDEALTSLRQSLADLRRALASESHRLKSPTTRTLRLDLTGTEVDVLRFDRLAGSPEPASLDRAVSLYRGPLLEGWCEPWVVQERETRQERYLAALERLAADARSSGDAGRAVHYLHLATAADPLREACSRALMHAHAGNGECEAAVQAYYSLRRRLWEELSAEPGPETSRLYQEIRNRVGPGMPPAGRVPGRQEAMELSPGQIPRPLTALLGQERELEEARSSLLSSRLVTLTGPGGIGKTRLALELAADLERLYADGAAFVDLSALSDGAQVPQAIAAGLGARVEEQRPALEQLVEALRARQLLLVADNCEHLLPGIAGTVDSLLRGCPGVRVLATSRERLGLTGEVCRPLAPLTVPLPHATTDADALESFPAVRLFLERAAAVCPGVRLRAPEGAAVAGICRRLDGLPLAIELAASLADVLSPAEIRERLRERLELPAGDYSHPERHRTLGAVIAWSYERLAEPERTLFRRLAVFSGGATLAAIEAVAAGDTSITSCAATILRAEVFGFLSALVRKSLVVAEARDGATRYRMLETIREYARERLVESGESDLVRRRHLAFFAGLAEQAEPALTGPEQAAWLARLDAEYDNFRAALGFPEGGAALLRLAGALGRFWQIRGYFSEGRERLRAALSLSRERTPARAKALSWAGVLAVYQGDYGTGTSLCEEAAAIWRDCEDTRGLAGTLGCLAIIAKDTGHPDRAAALFEESLRLWRQSNDPIGIAGTLGYLGILAQAGGDLKGARARYEESLELRSRYGDRWGVAACLNNLGLLAMAEGRYAPARECLERSLALRREFGDRRCQAITLNNLGMIACRLGDLEAACAPLRESLELARDLGDRRSIAYSLEAHARLAAVLQQPHTAARLCGAAYWLRESIAAPLPPRESEEQEQWLQEARHGLEGDAFDALRREGQALSPDEAVRLAASLSAPKAGLLT